MTETVADPQGRQFELREISCPTCRQNDTRFLGYRGGESQRYHLGVKTRIVQCRRCRLIFPNPFPFPRAPQELYGDPEKYFGSFSGDEKVESNRGLLRQIAKKLGTRSFSVLDVGSGQGEFIRAAQLEGAAATGLEFSVAMIAQARQRYGLELLPMSIEDLATRKERVFDVVVMNAVLEHVYDPDSMIKAAARLTRAGGVLYIDVPQEPSLLTRIGNLANRLRGSRTVYNLSPTWPPYHVFGFNPHAMRVLLDKHGFKITFMRIHNAPEIPSRPILKDRIQALIGTQINRIGNWTGTACNMYVWAQRKAAQ